MKLGNITHKILRGVVAMHRAAVKFDCACADRTADKHFDNAALQLQLVNRAKEQLCKVQDTALLARSQASWERMRSNDELDAIRVGKTRG